MIQRKPFERTLLDEERKQRDIFSVEMNPEIREWFDEGKRMLDEKSDPVAIRRLALIGFCALHSFQGQGMRKALLKKKLKLPRSRAKDHF